MGRDNELTLEAVRRAHAAPREVTADRWLLVALILGPIVAVMTFTASGALDVANGLGDSLDRVGRGCPPACGELPATALHEGAVEARLP